jgi:hypothetical protein
MDKDLTLCARCLETVGSVEEDLIQVDGCLEMCRSECAKSNGGAVEGVWRLQGYGGGAWQVSGGRGWPVVSGLHRGGYPDRRAEDITKCGAESGAWERNGGALGGFENGGKIAEAALVSQVVCCG